MNIIEAQFVSNVEPPTCCTYCDQEKSFLMVKPVAFSHKGEMLVNVNKTRNHLWICLECFSMELDGMGCSVDIYEYE